MKAFRIYIAASFRHLNGARLLGAELRRLGCEILDWTEMAAPPPGLTAAQRRIWMDTDKEGGEVFAFCHAACLNADLVIYYGESGQDAAVEVGLAAASGTPVMGIRGPLESPGLMLHGAVDVWVESAEQAIAIIQAGMSLRNADADVMAETRAGDARALAERLFSDRVLKQSPELAGDNAGLPNFKEII